MNSSLLIILIVTAFVARESVSVRFFQICEPDHVAAPTEDEVVDAYLKLMSMSATLTGLSEWIDESYGSFYEEMSSADYDEKQRILERHLIRVCTIYGMI